jgi:predicted glycosyltransferase
MKALGTLGRALALAGVVGKERPALSVCHGSRGCLLASKLLGIPNLTLTDYEFAARIPSIRPTWLMVPSVIPAASFKFDSNRLMTYPGIKEDVYLPQFRPDPELRRRLGISSRSLMITVRPPASEAHYHNPESESLLTAVLDRLTTRTDIRVVLLPRNKRQETDLRAARRENIAAGRIVVPSQVEDGLNLIWNSDLVISGGGTMNREAAAMGVPVYSIFRGTIGAVDRYLAERGRLVLIETIEDVRSKIRLEPRQREFVSQRAFPAALETIVQSIISLADGDKSSVGYAA